MAKVREMTRKFTTWPPWIRPLLACPACRNPLPGSARPEEELRCFRCGFRPAFAEGIGDFLVPGHLDEVTRKEARAWPEYATRKGPLSRGMEVATSYPHPLAEGSSESFWRPGCPGKRLRALEGLAQPGQQEILERSLLHLALSARGRALEIGCGFAWASRDLALAGWQVAASDPSPGMLALARQHHEELDLAIPLLLCPGQRLPFVDGSFDLVFCASVLHHVADGEKLFREIRRVLRKDGRFVALYERFEAVGTSKEDFLRSSDAGRAGLHEGFVVLPELVDAMARAGLRAEVDVPWHEGRSLPRRSGIWGGFRSLISTARRSGMVDVTARPSSWLALLLSRIGATVIGNAARLFLRLGSRALPGRDPDSPEPSARRRRSSSRRMRVTLLDGWYEPEGHFRWSEAQARFRLEGHAGHSELRLLCSTLVPQTLEIHGASRLLACWKLHGGHHRLRLDLPPGTESQVFTLWISPTVPPASRPHDPRPLGLALRHLQVLPLSGKKIPTE